MSGEDLGMNPGSLKEVAASMERVKKIRREDTTTKAQEEYSPRYGATKAK
jgi:hypothetical protein